MPSPKCESNDNVAVWLTDGRYYTHLNDKFSCDRFVVAELIGGMMFVGKLVHFEDDIFVVVAIYSVKDSVTPGWPPSEKLKKIFLLIDNIMVTKN